MGLCKDCKFYANRRKGRKGYCKYWKEPKLPTQTSIAFKRKRPY